MPITPVRLEVVGALRPKLRVRNSFGLLERFGSGGTDDLDCLLNVTFETPDFPAVDEEFLACPSDIEEEVKLFRVAERALSEALDEASDIGISGLGELASRDVRSFSSPRSHVA